MTFVDRLLNYKKAAFPCLLVKTTEEARLMGDVLTSSKRAGRGLVVWSAMDGLRRVVPKVTAFDDTNDLFAALREACKLKDCVVVLRDAHTWPLDRDPVLGRALRHLLQEAPQLGITVVLTAPDWIPPPTIERLVTVLDYDLPSPDDLRTIAKRISEAATAEPGGPKAADLGITDDLVRAMSGLTATEAENALALSCVEARGFDVRVVYREKVAAVRRSGLLTVVDPDERGLSAIGGLDTLKAWIVKRRAAYTPAAREYGLRAPKGILLVGVPGTGKSLSAKCIGTALNVPTLRGDISALFAGLVGQSEQQTRDMLKLAEAMAPCVLWLDEIDKGFAGTQGSGENDSGVGRRVFGTIISWMQERKAPVFVCATANQVASLPPELLRKGRFDEIFAVDLPSETERKVITEIQLRARSRKPEKFDVAAVAKATEGFTGSEIESVIDEALFDAFSDGGRELATPDLATAAERTVPLSVTAKEQVNGIREWAKTRARFASAKTGDSVPVEEAGPRRRIVGVAALIEEDAPASGGGEKGGQN